MKTTMSQGEVAHLLSKKYAMKAFGMDSAADKQYIDGFNNALALADSELEPILTALKNIQATAQAVIVSLESKPVVLGFIQEHLPAAWPMFEECTSFASDAIDRATTQKEGVK